MGVSWNGVVQALLLGLAIQMIASALCIVCACLWESMKKRMSRPAGGEPVAEPDLEIGTVNGGEGIDLAANRSVADDEDALHEGKLGSTENVAGSQNGTVCSINKLDVHSVEDGHDGLLLAINCSSSSFSAAAAADSAPMEHKA